MSENIKTIEKCKTKITPLVRKCMESKTCIDLNKNNPLFLDRANEALKGQPFIMEKQYTTDVEAGSVFSYKVVRKNMSDAEYDIGRKLNSLRGEINNFCYTFEKPLLDGLYGNSYYDSSGLIEHVDGKSLGTEMYMDNLYAHYQRENFDNFNDSKREKYHSIFLQVFLALHIAFGRFGFVHNDLHPDNIIITTFPEERWVDYPVRLINKTFRVKTKYFPTIIDYGLSQIIDENGKVVMDDRFDLRVYCLVKKYCIPIRDWTKLFFRYPKIGKFLYGDDKKMEVLGVVDSILRPILDDSYRHLPNLSKVLKISKMSEQYPFLASLYDLQHSDVVNALLHTFTERYPSKLIFRDCYLVDFYQKIPDFVLDTKNDLFIETYVSLLSEKGDGFIDTDDETINTICDTLYEEMRNLLESSDRPRSVMKSFKINDDILRIQEKMAMIPVKNRGKFKKLDELVQKHLKKLSESIIKF